MIKIKLYGTRQQRDVVYCNSRYISFFAGRRYGKTFNARNRALFKCWSKSQFLYAFMAPTYAQTVKQYEAISTHPEMDQLIRKAPKKPFNHIIFHNGSRIDFRSLKEPEQIRGEKYNEVWVDEIQDVQEAVMEKIIIPTLRDTRGTLVISGQFRGHNWYYEKFYKPGSEGRRGYSSWAIPTNEGLMFQDADGKAEWEEIKRTTPEAVLRQEYLCIPTDNQNAAFDPEQINRCISGEPLTGPTMGAVYVIGLDLGKVKDQTAIVIQDAKTGHVAHASKLPNGMEHEEQAARVAKIAQTWKATVFMDTTGGATGGHAAPDAYVKFYRQHIPELRPVWWSIQNKEKMISELSLAIQQRRISIPKVYVDLIRELKNYEATYKNSRWHYGAANGAHDDYVSALAMAHHGRQYYQGGGGAPVSALL